ncbi:response regulator transcription factor [Macrococcus equi]|uniref:response regulator transcription factor n=1 Tax=Macrococcus equi TaxID=3395462 RepID=UPI0039BDF677
MKGFNILIVEDDSFIAKSLKKLFESKGANVRINATGENVIEQLDDIHLILMDVMLPYNDGISITKAIRLQFDTPIIFLSARNDIESKLNGLNNGEDYLTKPFHPLELIARVEKILSNLYDEQFKIINGFQVDVINKLLKDSDGKEVKLSKTERKLFFYLFNNINIILNKDQIINHVWPNGDTYENSLNVYIKKLRKKLNDDGTMINTIYGIGYRLNKNEK